MFLMFSDVLRMLSIAHRCSILRCVQMFSDVQRCFQVFTDVLGCWMEILFLMIFDSLKVLSNESMDFNDPKEFNDPQVFDDPKEISIGSMIILMIIQKLTVELMVLFLLRD